MFGRREVLDSVDFQPGRPQPLLHLRMAEAEPAMRLALPQELQFVRREVDDEHPPSGRERRGALRYRGCGIIEEVEYLVDDDQVETVAKHGQIGAVADSDSRMGDASALQIG